jgi:hypothetical protein
MFRPAMLTAAATLALGALSAAPAEAAARLPLAPETTLAAAEWSATGTRSGAAVVLVAPRHWRNQDECAAGPVLPVGRRVVSLDECAQAAPVVPVGRHMANQDECAAGPVVPAARRIANQDECAAGSVMPVGVRVP